ncbi:circularly permuted type 2 ATP-grasp protein [Blastopirellula sp. JC732]|uniref:Circularly permuted type 2 ATP-grasp protein n=1 Tax=Blastopirellula sediminis TaxID=2894196 RepID=A0A9X1MQI4_9BACT|nr:circularly permuted type 2 ATP-grasp protein [Blastopirellula sediminis]MCC9605077.1 circularly permuted type 2 ATP-grasp protein [Blastopirellula sediminis]MCC9631623.1 circularly permuted type 2 ATP-grasp protein [Blastopirellula sediminis]
MQQQTSMERVNGVSEYDVGEFYDEMFAHDASPRENCNLLYKRVIGLTTLDLQRRKLAAERSMVRLGITFNVYGDEEGTERIIPFDILPRIINADEWKWVSDGLKQRIVALNMFIDDVYGDQKILKDGAIPEHVVRSAASFRPQCVGLKPPKGVWCHITGTDLVRDQDGKFYVLEDNLRCPSGVSYVLQNRQLMKQAFPDLFESLSVRPVDDYCGQLLDALNYLAEDRTDTPTVGVLTPGVYNSAYFEHSFLAQQMGVDLVEGRDLVVQDKKVYMRTTKGLAKIDVLYRRIDDDFIDPRVFREDSLLGVPGLIEAYKAGNIALANAPGTGIADDKVIYAYVPDIIKYYLGEDPILPNVPTYVCWDEKQRDHVLNNLHNFVVKPANESGGYGMLIGPRSTREEQAKFADLIKSNPRNYIAQPTLSLSRAPVIIEDHLEGRHVDLRPFIIYGRDVFVLPGGLTRVALKKGSLVVNSSQGGGSKDTWVVEELP